MNLKERVNYISKFCGVNHDHSNMIDERQKEISFNIELKEEIEIKNIMSEVNIIILTGEAGDGKSRMLRNIEKDLYNNGFEIFPDFSALNEEERENIIIDIENLLSDESDEPKEKKYIIAANVGIFTKTLLKKNVELLAKLTSSNKVKIINFQKRNLAKKQNEKDKIFESIIEKFIKYDIEDCNCNLKFLCPFKENLDKLKDPIVIENIRVLCDSLYLMDEHITFRELLSLIAYMATGGEDCKSILKDTNNKNINYYNVFKSSNDILLKKFSKLDPAQKDRIGDNKIYNLNNRKMSLTIYIETKRKYYFEVIHEDAYDFLPIDYLSEFREIIKNLHHNPYYFKARGNNNIFVDVKTGIISLISPQETNLEISFYDTPHRISKEIKTKFNIDINDVELIWNRCDFQFKQGNLSLETENNTFSLSCYLSEKAVSLNINYTLFKYILSAKNGLYLDKNSDIVEEFGLSDFFRKVLKNNSNAYEKMQVIFCEKDTVYIDFELIKYKDKNIFSKLDEPKKVMIKKI